MMLPGKLINISSISYLIQVLLIILNEALSINFSIDQSWIVWIKDDNFRLHAGWEDRPGPCFNDPLWIFSFD